MSIELTMLVYTVALLVVVVLIQAATGVLAQGLATMAGSRDNLGEPSVFQARMGRVVDNHREGLLMFAPLVLIAHAIEVSSSLTVLATQIYFYSRVAHALLYIAGVPWIRPVAFAAGLLGLAMLFFELLTT